MTRCFICLTLGVLATLLLAWAPALLGPDVPDRHEPQQYLGPIRTTSSPPTWGWFSTRHAAFAHSTIIFRKGVLREERTPDSPRDVLPHWAPIPDRGMRVDVHGYGWPLAAFRAERSSPQGTHTFWVVHDAAPPARDVTLPIKPILSGFILDSLFLTFVCLIAWRSWLWLRRWRRRRASQCPECGYCLSSLLVCPECGGRISHVQPAPSADG